MSDTRVAEIAAALREAADQLDALTLDYLEKPLWVRLHIQPLPQQGQRGAAHAVDEIATALLGEPGETTQITAGTWHHAVDGGIGPIHVSVFTRVADPAAVDKDAEIERLRAELAALTVNAALVS